MSNASVERLWKHALKRAGTAIDASYESPPLPTLKMRDLASALLHFVELIDSAVPKDFRPQWERELTLTRQQLAQNFADRPFQRIDPVATWPNLALAVRDAGLRAIYSPGLAGVAQRAVVGIAFSLLREHAGSRAAANELIRTGLERLAAGMWLAAARARLDDETVQIRRAWWGAPQLALFELEQEWWLVRMKPGRPVAIERGSRDDMLASVPDAHFKKALEAVMNEPRME